jgi:DNA-binding GntR family transcriptional regulator
MSTELALQQFAKVASPSRVEIVADQLRAAIADGSLREGQQLTEFDLAAGFGISRPTLREALQRLVQEGLLVSVQHRGTFVVEISDQDVVDIYNARRAIESSAALALMGAPQPAILEGLTREYESMTASVRAGAASELTAADQRFHEVLVNSLNNPRLQRVTRTFLVETRLCLARLEGKYELPQEAVDEHLAIIHAIESGSAIDVLRAIDVHMDNAILLLTGNIQHRPARATSAVRAR